jgi:hypothetical protein
MFIASDGVNYEIANSYVDLEYADAYHAVRGNSLWTGTDEQKQAALIKATDYIEQVYGQRFIAFGYSDSLLAWPRYDLMTYENLGIPENLKKAVSELALEALSNDLNPVINPVAAVKREKVDVLETEYFEAKADKPLRPAVIGYLLPLLSGTSFNRKVVRV